ncbi:MAG: hypothetical protein JNM57_10020 [Cyclobacteriaceae bacterium]|nr:hypothetical protein [Cyclobacteriaceae bacterium]
MKRLLLLLSFILPFLASAQQSVSIGTTTVNPKAVLFLKATGGQGLLLPIVSTSSRTGMGLGSGDEGMLVYDLDADKIFFWTGSSWVEPGATGSEVDGVIGNEISQINTARGGLELTGTGTTASPLTLGLIQGTVDGQVLKWNNTTKRWELGTAASTTYTAGTGITINGTNQIGITANGVSATELRSDATTDANRSVTTNHLRDGAVTTTKILDGTVTNADISSTAAISVSKLAPSGTNGHVLQTTGGVPVWGPIAAGLTNPMTTLGDIIIGGNAGAPARLGGSAGFLKSTGAVAPIWSAVNLASTDVTGTLPLANGGTGATTAAAARTNIGLGTLSTLNGVTTTEITDGTIANADVNATAAIAGTKISPNFGAQNIQTTGNLNTAGLTATGTTTFGALAGTGSRMVVADPTGVLGTQAIPSTFSTLNVVPKGDGTSGLTASSIYDDGNVGIGTTTPYNKFSILGTNGSPTGGFQSFFTTADAHPTLQVMNWGHSDIALLFDSYLSTGNTWTSSSPTSNFKIHKYSNLQFDYSSGVAQGGSIGWSTAMSITPTGNVQHQNYTQLGSGAPSVQTAYFTGTVGSANSTTSVNIGIPHSRVISVTVMVGYAGNTGYVPPGYTNNPGYQFNWYLYSTFVDIWLTSGNSANLANQQYRVLVTYTP